MALKIASIYFLDPRRTIEGGFSLRGNGLLNGLLPGVLLTAILLGLGTDTWAQAVAQEVDHDWLWDHHVSIEFLEDGL